MIDEIDYFPKRDKYKKKKGLDSDEEWEALKKIKTGQDIPREKSKKKPGKDRPKVDKKERKPMKS